MDKGRGKDHAYSVDIAVAHGIPAALLYHDIEYWCSENAERGQNVYDGCAWMYRSLKEFHDYFPELNLYAIRKGLETLIDARLILEANYNRAGMDRTKWYTTQVDLFSPGKGGNRRSHLSKSTNGVSNPTNGDAKSTNGVSNPTNAFVESSICICRNQQTNTIYTASIQSSTTSPVQVPSEAAKSTVGAASSSRPAAAPVLSETHLKVIRSKTQGFRMDQLQELMEKGDSEIEIALALYPCKSQVTWSAFYTMRLEKLKQKQG